MIDLNQNSLVRLKTKVAESAKDIVFCVGSGVSSEAGAPSWGQLFNLLADEAFAQLKNIVDVSADKDEAELIYLRETKNFWKGFERIKNIIGDDHYYRAIKEEFDKFINVEPPKILKRIWSLKGVNAVITPNVDNFVLDAHRKTRPAQNYIAHFNSLGVKDRLHLIRNSEPFIFHMHGNFDQASSLVFSESDLSRLFGNKSYIEFMKGVFLRYSVIFIGVTADDRAFDEILLRVREAGISFADHYWITTRRDMNTHNWSVKYGIKGIYYDPIFDSSGKAVHFDALNTIFDEIEGFKSYDVDPEIIIPSDIPESPVIPSDDLMRMPSNNDRRLALAGMAKSILINSEENTQSPEYRKFVRDYALPIHTAWFISNEYPENDFMGYKVEKKEVDGKFSNIWIVSQKGQRYALKMLKQENIQDSIYLDSFRRGVQSLRYLSNNGVDESVRLVSAYEIPASLIMEYIDGINLEDLVRKREFDFWGSGLPIVISIAKHLLKCHNLNETVLHRDVRPRNVILENCIDDASCKVRMINYDMSWHEGAKGEDANSPNSQIGYQAPELISSRKSKISREASVDVYGVGMTMYYMASGKNPPIGGGNAQDWHQEVGSKLAGLMCQNWRSLNKRLERLIMLCTNVHPSQRPSMGHVISELNQLYEVVRGEYKKISADFWAEEVLSRAGYAYRQSTDEKSYRIDLLEGRETIIFGNLTENSVDAQINISAAGKENWENIKKRLKERFEESINRMTQAGWKKLPDTGAFAREARLSFRIDVTDLEQKIDQKARALGDVIQAMKL